MIFGDFDNRDLKKKNFHKNEISSLFISFLQQHKYKHGVQLRGCEIWKQ